MYCLVRKYRGSYGLCGCLSSLQCVWRGGRLEAGNNSRSPEYLRRLGLLCLWGLPWPLSLSTSMSSKLDLGMRFESERGPPPGGRPRPPLHTHTQESGVEVRCQETTSTTPRIYLLCEYGL